MVFSDESSGSEKSSLVKAQYWGHLSRGHSAWQVPTLIQQKIPNQKLKCFYSVFPGSRQELHSYMSSVGYTYIGSLGDESCHIPRSIPIYRTSFSPPVHDDFFVMSHLLGSKYSFEMAKVMENKIAYNYKLPFFNSSNIRVKTGLNILSGLGTGAGTKPVSKEKCLKRVYQYNTICYRLEGKSWIFSMQNHAQLW